ncbi:MAG: YtxH domain-containing protein [Elusimicrobia bacterium]|nr:YtxH domain-containing protein [Elusimicrobiota bacterium]
MEHDARKWTAYAGYFFSGAAIGAGLGVLFAPRAGRETREKMSRWLKEKREKGGIEYRAMREALEAGRKTFASKEKELSKT